MIDEIDKMLNLIDDTAVSDFIFKDIGGISVIPMVANNLESYFGNISPICKLKVDDRDKSYMLCSSGENNKNTLIMAKCKNVDNYDVFISNFSHNSMFYFAMMYLDSVRKYKSKQLEDKYIPVTKEFKEATFYKNVNKIFIDDNQDDLLQIFTEMYVIAEVSRCNNEKSGDWTTIMIGGIYGSQFEYEKYVIGEKRDDYVQYHVVEPSVIASFIDVYFSVLNSVYDTESVITQPEDSMLQ